MAANAAWRWSCDFASAPRRHPIETCFAERATGSHRRANFRAAIDATGVAGRISVVAEGILGRGNSASMSPRPSPRVPRVDLRDLGQMLLLPLPMVVRPRPSALRRLCDALRRCGRSLQVLVALVLLVGPGCRTKQCADIQLMAVDEARMCLRPRSPAAGLRVCMSSLEAQGKGLASVCLVDGAGQLFLGWVAPSQWLEGSSWTHSAFGDTPSTLTADGQARCSRAPAPSVVQTCP
jgi:hypothetical protein